MESNAGENILKMNFKEYIKGVYQKLSVHENRRLFLTATVTLFTGAVLGLSVGVLVYQKQFEETLAKMNGEIEKQQQLTEELQGELSGIREEAEGQEAAEEKELPWYLILVNYNNPMKEDYEPELKELEPGYSVDVRIADAAKEMLADAKADGMRIDICSAYRSVNRQKQLFEESVEERLGWGLDYWEAFEDTRRSVAEPGTSEHALGLALDLTSNEYTELDEGQEHTKEAKWLAENCHKYGFILRYPPEKTDITGIIYEPWHYRYVGVEDATRIMELGITLEEYLEEYY